MEKSESITMGVRMDLISEDKIASMTSTEKLRFALDSVKAGKIVILESGLTSEEQMKLIELTMTEVDDDFPGIEMSGYPSKKGFLNLRRKMRPTVVGPVGVMRTIRRERDLISAFISAN